MLRELDNAAAQFLLDGTVQLLRLELPANVNFGDVIALDTKHIIAWVKENNPKAYVSDRYAKTKQPKGDPDCKLGCKKRHNQGDGDGGSAAATVYTPAAAPPPLPPPRTPTTNPIPARQASVGEYYRGYASGVITTKVPDWGEFVLAELTQTFDHGDATYFFPLMAATERPSAADPAMAPWTRPTTPSMSISTSTKPAALPPCRSSQRAASSPVVSALRAYRSVQPGCPCRSSSPSPTAPVRCWSTTVASMFVRCAASGRRRCAAPAAPVCPVNHEPGQGGCTAMLPTCAGAGLRYQLDRTSPAYKAVYSSAPPTNAPIAKPSNSASSGPACAASPPLSTRIP